MKKKKYLALFLGLSMALTAAPVGVYADPTDTDKTPVQASENGDGTGSDTTTTEKTKADIETLLKAAKNHEYTDYTYRGRYCKWYNRYRYIPRIVQGLPRIAQGMAPGLV